MPRCLVPSKTLKGSKGNVTSDEEGHDVVMAGVQCVVAKDTDDMRSPAARRVKSLPRRKDMTPNHETTRGLGQPTVVCQLLVTL